MPLKNGRIFSIYWFRQFNLMGCIHLTNLIINLTRFKLHMIGLRIIRNIKSRMRRKRMNNI